MDVCEMAVPHAFRITPRVAADTRGCFYESFKCRALAEATGRPFQPEQANFSVSRRGTLRGIHSVTIPPGQAKYVTCVRGAVLDIVVDIRLGSPTFGVFDTTVLDTETNRSVFVAEGLGHGFVALTDDACVGYLCSTAYVPGTQFEIDPLDPELSLPWNLNGPPLMSTKDAGARRLAEAARAGILPSYTTCLELYEKIRAAG